MSGFGDMRAILVRVFGTGPELLGQTGQVTLRHSNILGPSFMVNTVYLNGTSGNDTLVVDSNNQYVVNGEAGDDLIKVELTTNAGGIYIGYANSYTGGPGNDTIEITGSNTWAAFQAFSPTNSIETIKGDGPEMSS